MHTLQYGRKIKWESLQEALKTLRKLKIITTTFLFIVFIFSIIIVGK